MHSDPGCSNVKMWDGRYFCFEGRNFVVLHLILNTAIVAVLGLFQN